MNGVMVRKALRDWQSLMLWFSLGMLAYILLFGPLWHPVRSAASAIEQYAQAFPKGVLAAFGVPQSPAASFSSFLQAEVFGFVWPIAAIIFVALAGSSAVAQELDQGTIDIWLSVPVSRARLLASKLVALLGTIVLFASVSVLGVMLDFLLAGEHATATGYARLFLVLGAFLLAVGGLAVCCSAVARTRGQAAGIAGGILFFMYVARVVAELSERLRLLRLVSIFTPFRTGAALAGDPIPWLGVLLSALLGVVAALVALMLFQQRDLAR